MAFFCNNKYKVIILDCDGVIFDSNDLKTQAFRLVLEKRKFDNNVIDKFIDHHVKNGGVSRYIKFERLYLNILHQDVNHKEVQSLLDDFSIECIKLYRDSQLTPGCKNFIKNFSKTHKLFIASGGDELELRCVFEQHQIKDYFEKIFGSPDTKEDCISKVFKLNKDVESSQYLFIGDSLVDYRSAKSKNIEFIFMTDFSDNKVEIESIASKNGIYTIKTLNDLR